MKRTIIRLVLIFTTLVFFCSMNSFAQWKSYKPLASSDDAEEHTTANATEGIGGMEPLQSSDLEIGDESDLYNQKVGIRFPGIDIEQGAQIDSAYIQLTCDDTDATDCTAAIWAEASDDAAPFTEQQYDISLRPLTEAIQIWEIPPWDVLEERGPKQRTPELAALVQEVLDRPGWTSGNAMVFIIWAQAGQREAESWDDHGADDTSGHPELFIKVTGSTAVEENNNTVVKNYELSQNYPNPFNPSTTIGFEIAKSGHVTLSVFNVLGQHVKTLVDQYMQAGSHTAQWNTTCNLTSGVYFYKIKAGDYVQIRKMTLMK